MIGKINITDNEKKKEDFPFLAQYKSNTKLIVLFTSDDQGLCIQEGDRGLKGKFGDRTGKMKDWEPFSSGWWTKVSGTVEFTN